MVRGGCDGKNHGGNDSYDGVPHGTQSWKVLSMASMCGVASLISNVLSSMFPIVSVIGMMHPMLDCTDLTIVPGTDFV